MGRRLERRGKSTGVRRSGTEEETGGGGEREVAMMRAEIGRLREEVIRKIRQDKSRGEGRRCACPPALSYRPLCLSAWITHCCL